jgi:microcystin-dependent protein
MTADTYTSTLGTLQMGTGNDNNAWGVNANVAVFQILEDAVANILTLSDVGGTHDLSLAPPPAGPSAARFWQLLANGALTSDLIVKVPNLSKEWLFNNACTLNGFTVTIQVAGGSSQLIPLGAWKVWCDGNGGIFLFPAGTLQFMPANGTSPAPTYSDFAEQNSGWYRHATQDWRLSINGVAVLTVTGAGAAVNPSSMNLEFPIALLFAGVPFDPTSQVPTGAEMPFAGLNAPGGWLLEFGQAVSRTTFANLFAAICPNTIGGIALTGTPTNGQPTIGGVSVDLVGLGVEGALIEGVGIITGTTITSVTSNTISITPNAVGGTAGETLRILPFGQGDGATTFNIPNRRGVVLAGRDNMGGVTQGNITIAGGNFPATELGASGGSQNETITQAQLPNVTLTTAIASGQGSHAHTVNTSNGLGNNQQVEAPGNAAGGNLTPTSTVTLPAMTGTTPLGGSGSTIPTVQPTAVTNYIIKI